MRSLRVAIASAFIVLAVGVTSGCPSPPNDETGTGSGTGGSSVFTPSPSTPKPTVPAVNTLGYDKHGCEMIYTATGWRLYTLNGVTYCYQRVGQAAQYNAYPWVRLQAVNYNFAAVQPVFLRDFSVGNGTLQIVRYSDPQRLWQRVYVNQSRASEVWYNNAWVTFANYEALEKQRLAQQTAQQQQAAQAARTASYAFLADITVRANNAAGAFLEPDCPTKYLYCVG